MRERYNQLLRETWNMQDGKQKLALLEEMILIADRYMTVEDAYQARMSYSSAALECGYPERLFVSFAWCLAKFEQQPGDYSSFMIMWHYKWVLNQVWRMPQLSLEKLAAVFEDFRQKCVANGYSLRPYYQQQINFLLSQGRMEEAASSYKQWRATPRDNLSDCKACEQNLFGHYYFTLNQNKKGLQLVKPILEGKMQCRSVPQSTYSNIIYPLLKLGEYDRAFATARKALRSLEGPQYLVEYGTFLDFYTVTDMPKATKLYERTIAYGLESKMPWDKLQYLLAARLFLQEWSKTRRRKKLAASEQVTPQWLDSEIAAIAGAFNARNGNSYVEAFIAEKERNHRKLVEEFRKASR